MKDKLAPTATESNAKKIRVIISGGGTGGHIFPALSIADEIKKRFDAEILFVGAAGRMEMKRVPEAGYKIVGLPVAGIDRKRPWKNIRVFYLLLSSMLKAKSIIQNFKPQIVIGVGGYASGPMLKAAQKAGIPTLIQEQNSYAGVTNKLLSKKAEKICVAYDNMEKYFPADKIIKTGNPIRKALLSNDKSIKVARESFGLNPERKTLLVVGGSLGALTINESLEKGIKNLTDKGIQVIWQTGKNFGNRGIDAAKGLKGVVVTQFISDMGAAYKAADLVVSRAGAASISELQALGKPAILVPSPNVAEDHQTHNAKALSSRGAAVLITDAEARDKLVAEAIRLIDNPEELATISREISPMGICDSDARIVTEVSKILNHGN